MLIWMMSVSVTNQIVSSFKFPFTVRTRDPLTCTEIDMILEIVLPFERRRAVWALERIVSMENGRVLC